MKDVNLVVKELTKEMYKHYQPQGISKMECKIFGERWIDLNLHRESESIALVKMGDNPYFPPGVMLRWYNIILQLDPAIDYTKYFYNQRQEYIRKNKST